MDLILFQPIYQERVWGGQKLAELPGRSLPPGGPYGESWEIVDRPEACSQITGGRFGGLTLRGLLRTHPEACMGPAWDPERRFPILVKWLDCRERLSLQVHPPATIAPELGGEPKTENWFIVDAEPNAGLIAGLEPGVTREAFAKALSEGEQLEHMVIRFPCRVGDSLFVPSGRLHAIDAGNFILEIQQNSDTTYRVYDWGRVGLDGKPRTLHVEESLKSIDFADTAPTLLHTDGMPGEIVLADSPVFRLRRIALDRGERLKYDPRPEARIVHVVSGLLRCGERTLPWGTNAFLPYAFEGQVDAEETSIVLITDRFTTL